MIHTILNNTSHITDLATQYDEAAKKLLAQKIVLAHILKRILDDFKDMDPKDIVPYIEGEPQIGVVPVDPGLTNATHPSETDEIIGFNTENTIINEGSIYFDIVLYVHRKCGLTKVILNVEPQKDEPRKYPVLNRGIFYVSRLISSQKYRDFKGQDYGDICEVYSVWICMNMPENSMCHIHLTQDDLVGEHKWDGNLNLMNLVMIGISNHLAKQDDSHDLLRFLGALFSKGLTSDERISIMEEEYDISSQDLGKDVETMCNLGEGIWEDAMANGFTKGVEKGIEKGLEKGRTETQFFMIQNMYRAGISIEKIGEVSGKTAEEIQEILEEK